MRCQEVVSVWISEVKQYEETKANVQSRNGRREYQISQISYAKGGYYKCVHMHTRARRDEKLVIRYVCTRWMAPNKCCGLFFCALVWPSTLEHLCQKNALVFLHHNYDYFVLCDNQFLHNFTYLLEGLWNWRVGRTALSNWTEYIIEN